MFPSVRILAFAFMVLALAACGANPVVAPDRTAAPTATAAGPAYPPARRGDQVDEYHGVRVADPYRWMEDLDAPELARWIAEQNRLTESWLADVPGRAGIKQRLTALYDYERYDVPRVHGDRYFYLRNDGLQNQSPLYVQDGPSGSPRVLLDPNTLSSDGTIALAEFGVSHDGRRIAYALSDGGSDWRTIRVRDVASGKDLDDEVRWAKFTGIAWARDGSGFWYSRYDAPVGENELKAANRNHKVYWHRLGTPQDRDTLVYERPDQPEWNLNATATDDGNYLVIAASQGTDERTMLFYRDLRDPGARVHALVPAPEAAHDFIGNDGATFYLRTDRGAERYRVAAVDLARPDPADWREVIPEGEATLQAVSLVNRQLIASSLRDAHTEVVAYDLGGKRLRAVSLPGLGTASGFAGGIDDVETFYSYRDFTTPATIYRYDAVSGATGVFKAPATAFDPALYETIQTFYASKDGTRVPMFITARKGTPRDGRNPVILSGYGGFNISRTPEFSPATIAWLELGGVYAVANLRGGGEYGRAWHEAGMKTRKQNVFDDFIAAAEYLVAQQWTSPARLAISGRSNGGLLVAAVLLQRPELFGAALPGVGVLDMLRFREFTIGWAWESDYGTVKDPDEFRALLAYSPLHNIREGVAYPPTLITTADRDDRVYPAHSFKFAAALQAAYPGPNPVLIRVETRAGHGAGKPTTKVIEETADIYAFLVRELEIALP